MKKILLIIICLIPISVNASTIVMDMDSKRVLYEDNINEKRLIASTSKIMTAMVVINNCDVSEVIEVDEDVLKSFGSGIYIEIGEKIKVIDLLYGLLLRSGNDAAIVLAKHVGGSQEGFVTMMNETAASLGMKNTTFINSSGLEDNLGNGNMSTAYDMALLMRYAMNNEIFSTITSTKKYMVKTNYKTYEWTNKNKLLTNYKYTTGGKTGYTKKAHRSLVTSARKDNKNLIIVTLNESDDFNKHEKLYEEYFKKYDLVNIIDSSTFLIDKGLYVDDSFNILLNKDEIDKVNIDVNYTKDVNDRVGYVNVLIDDKVYFTEDIHNLHSKSTYKVIDNAISCFKSLF